MIDLPLPPEDILNDYRLAFTSRLLSLKGRREVLGGRAKFGIFGDGKEIPQVALAHWIQKGDWRAGYYRDQTLLLALGELTPEGFFAQLYGDTDPDREPSASGRQMNCHFGNTLWDGANGWRDHRSQMNLASDLSPTGGQMPKLVGLGYASKLYRENPELGGGLFSHKGNEVIFGTIGNASTAEGLFWESFNAAGVLKIPLLISVWDDGYGISVPNSQQMTKGSISSLWQGFEGPEAFHTYKVQGWDYPELLRVYGEASQICRKTHRPGAVHVWDLNQPQGHSTSGSHERYKSPERLKYEDGIDGIAWMRRFLLKERIGDEATLLRIEKETEDRVDQARETAWATYQADILSEQGVFLNQILPDLKNTYPDQNWDAIIQDLKGQPVPLKKGTHRAVFQGILALAQEKNTAAKDQLLSFWDQLSGKRQKEYSTHLYSPAPKPQSIPPRYPALPQKVDGRQIIQKFFEAKMAQDSRIFIIGEDVGRLGGVNLEFDGLQERFGALRVTDTGIREATILGQGLGAALRGLKPIADIQYLDYLAYCFQGLTDDLATLHYRSGGRQVAPLIVRTKGHRLEGLWHTGSPLGMIVAALRGIYVCVPRNSLQAVGLYNTLLDGDNPGLMIEVLNGYRVKELLPENLTEYRIPLGSPEVILPGVDLTVVTYGACCRIAMEGSKVLERLGIHPEIIDLQTLLPMDREQVIRDSLLKTELLLVFDEDVPGGASAYILQEILEKQRAWDLLDGPPRTLTAKEHRSPYGSDGDYFSKPNEEDFVQMVYGMMGERFPQRFPSLF